MRSTQLLLLFLAISLSGCGWFNDTKSDIKNAVSSTEDLIKDSIDQLADESSSWQTTLQELASQLTDEAQSTIRNEINDLLQRSIAATGAELRCNTDFIGDRARQGLERILAKITGAEVAPPVPAICSVTPSSVDIELVQNNRLKTVEIYGYDLDQSDWRLQVQRSGGFSHSATDAISLPSHYKMTINLGGNGAKLNSASQNLELSAQGELISTIGVIQPNPKICESKTIEVDEQELTNKPPHTDGDKNFKSNGPEISTYVKLEHDDESIKAKFYVRAKETKRDWTTAKGTIERSAYSVEKGWKIESIGSDTYTHHKGTYPDKGEMSKVHNGSSELVKRFNIYGNKSNGILDNQDDAGDYTKVIATLNKISVNLIENEDCVSESEYNRLRDSSLLSPTTIKKLEKINPVLFKVGKQVTMPKSPLSSTN